MSKKTLEQLRALRMRMVKKHAELKVRVSKAQHQEVCVDEGSLKRWKRHKLLAKDIISAADVRLADVGIEELQIAAE